MVSVVQAETPSIPNVSDCLEEGADCPDEEPSSINDTENETNEESNGNGNDEVVGGSTGPLFFDFIKLIFALLLVLALIYFLLKFVNKRNKLFSNVKALDNLGGISVGTNKSIQIIRIGSRFFVIGVGDNIEMLQEITDEELINDLTQQKDVGGFDPNGFISSFLQKRSNPSKDDGSTNQSNQTFKKLFTTELDQLKQQRKKIMNQHKEDYHE